MVGIMMPRINSSLYFLLAKKVGMRLAQKAIRNKVLVLKPVHMK